MAPDQVYAGDITCLWTQQGWLYLAVVIDLYSRKVVGLECEFPHEGTAGLQCPQNGYLATSVGSRTSCIQIGAPNMPAMNIIRVFFYTLYLGFSKLLSGQIIANVSKRGALILVLEIQLL